jgi:hypothetical protein
VHGPLQFFGEGCIDQSLALHSGQSAKHLGNHCHGKVAFPSLPGPGVTLMVIAVIHDLERGWSERSCELADDGIPNLAHDRLPFFADIGAKRVSTRNSAPSILDCENFDRILSP